MSSVEVARTALFSSILALVDVITYKSTWPLLPPIVVAPFFTSFILGMSMPFSKHQWMVGFVASLITVFSTGGILPGPYILPIYGFVFQTARIKSSGALASASHMFYGVFLAPMIFQVAPAKIVYNWFLVYLGSLAPAIMVVTLIFIFGGATAAALGHKIGLRIAKNLKPC